MDNIAAILAHWGIAYHVTEQIYVSAWRIDDNYILKTGSDIDSVRRHVSITDSLREHGIPVAEIVPTLTKDAFLIADGRYYLLSKRLPGKHVEHVYDQNYFSIARKAGEIIAKLHMALREIMPAVQCWDNNLADEMSGWVKAQFEVDSYSLIPRHEFDASLGTLEEFRGKLPRQLIHRDIHFGNLLFEDGEISGYIDFDLSQINCRIFDVCYFALGLLIDVFSDEDKSEKWFQVLHAILLGYEGVDSLTLAEKQACACVMECIELLFTAYFLKYNNLASAENAARMYNWLKRNNKKIEDILNH